MTVAGIRGRNLTPQPAAQFYPTEILLRHALARLGWHLAVHRRTPSQEATHLMISRCRNGFVFAGFSPDDSAVYALGTPLGAPLIPGRGVELEGGRSLVRVNRWFHEEVRVFVEQRAGRVRCHAHPPQNHLYRTRLMVSGLEDATVRFLLATGCEQRTGTLLNPDPWILAAGEPFAQGTVETPYGRCLEMRRVTGRLTIAWGPDNAVTPVLPPD